MRGPTLPLSLISRFCSYADRDRRSVDGGNEKRWRLTWEHLVGESFPRPGDAVRRVRPPDRIALPGWSCPRAVGTSEPGRQRPLSSSRRRPVNLPTAVTLRNSGTGLCWSRVAGRIASAISGGSARRGDRTGVRPAAAVSSAGAESDACGCRPGCDCCNRPACGRGAALPVSRAVLRVQPEGLHRIGQGASWPTSPVSRPGCAVLPCSPSGEGESLVADEGWGYADEGEEAFRSRDIWTTAASQSATVRRRARVSATYRARWSEPSGSCHA